MNQNKFYFKFVNEKHFFCYYTCIMIKSNEWAINCIKANSSPDWYYPCNTQKQPFADIPQNRGS